MFSICDKCIVNVLRNRNTSVIQQINNIASSRHQPLISCKRKEYNFQLGQNANNLNKNNLASKGWHHKKSKGDFFIFHSTDRTQIEDFHDTFAQLDLNKTLITNLNACSIVSPTSIQSKAIPVLLSRKNTIIAAETGCGKTLSYLLPAVQQIMEQKVINQDTKFNAPLCLILTPSRELAFQINADVNDLLKDSQIVTDVIVGGGTKRKILNPSFKEVDLLIATPGALNKLANAGIYKMSEVRHVILDEADTLLDESFSADLCLFLKRFPFNFSGESSSTACQLTLVSATMPTNLPEDIANVVVPESLVRVTTSGLHKLQPHVPQMFLRISQSMKPSQLLQMVKGDTEKHYPVLIFSNKSATCDWISMFLSENGIDCINLNGDMSLALRKNRFLNFQRGNVNVLSCTDIGSRGLNTTRVKHVINYEFPKYIADYIHRCGRTGRINSPDNCQITNFVSGVNEINLVQKIEMAMRKQNCLPNVDGNIAGILQRNFFRNIKGPL